MQNNHKVNVNRRYFDIDEIANITGLKVADIIHMAGQGDFPVYALADQWMAKAYVHNLESGKWEVASPRDGGLISGAVRLYPNDIQGYEGNPLARISRCGRNANCIDPDEPDDDWEFRLKGEGVAFANCKLVVMTSDIEGIDPQAPVVEKPLQTRERNNLLKLIAALAQASGHDLKQATKSSIALESLIDGMGMSLEAQTIEKNLKAALSISSKSLPKKKP